jgi:hypothetical protein
LISIFIKALVCDNYNIPLGHIHARAINNFFGAEI